MELKVNDPKLIEAIFNGDAPDIYFAPDVDTLIAEKDALIAELKQKLQDHCIHCPVKEQEDDVVAELKQKLEDVQASAYAESVDAGMRERRLRRALYKACANWAMNARMVEIEVEPWGENHESRLWAGVYDKCIKKAEEYK